MREANFFYFKFWEKKQMRMLCLNKSKFSRFDCIFTSKGIKYNDDSIAITLIFIGKKLTFKPYFVFYTEKLLYRMNYTRTTSLVHTFTNDTH